MKVLKFLFVGILLIFPFGELLRFQFESGFGITLLDVGMTITALWFLLYAFLTKSFPKTNLYKPIGIFVAACIASLLIQIFNFSSEELLISSLYIVRFISFSALIIMLLQFDEKFMKRIPFIMVISGGLFVAFCFLQFFLYPTLRNLYYVGWDEHMYRLFGTFLDPNFTGAFLALFLLFTFNIFLHISFQKQRYRSSILLVLIVFSLIALFLTFSRSAYLMLLVSSGVFLFLQKKVKIFVGLVALFLMGILLISPQFNKENVNLFRVTSSLARVENTKEALFLFTQNPVLGVGFNTYRFARAHYGFGKETVYPSHSGSGVDNSFLFVLTTSGVIGFAAYAYLWVVIIKSVYRSHSSFRFITIALIAGLFVDSMFINSLFYSFIILWIFMMLGLALRSSKGNT